MTVLMMAVGGFLSACGSVALFVATVLFKQAGGNVAKGMLKTLAWIMTKFRLA